MTAQPRKKPANYRPILQFENAKTTKGEKLGYRTGILYLSPARESGRVNLCSFASDGCKKTCLYTSGMAGVFETINQARVAKTLFMLDHREDFEASLRYDIEKLIRDAAQEGLIPAIRLNGTSDVPKLALKFAREFPAVQFYDYTKIARPWLRQLANYQLTFSRSESNAAECLEALEHGVNVAVVFDTKKGQPLPADWNGVQVIDGDLHDLRFLDAKGVIVGLRAKGTARKDQSSGFVQLAA